MDGGDSGADRALTDYEFARSGDEGGVSDFDAFDVSDGVVGAGSAIEGDSEFAGAGLGLGGGGEGECEEECEDKENCLWAVGFGLR
jgi:hypothetical protein